MEKRKKILENLDEIEKEIQINADIVPERLFQTMEAFTKLAFVFQISKGKHEWLDGLAFFKSSENKILEGFLEDLRNGTENAMDELFLEELQRFEILLEGLGTQWREITNSLGILTTQENQNTLFLFFGALIESLRIWISYSSLDSSMYRVLFAFSQTLLESLRGKSSQAIFSSIGLLGKQGFYLNNLLRFILNILESILPDLQNELEFPIYQDIPRTLIVWFFYRVCPEPLEKKIRTIFQEVFEIAEKEDIVFQCSTTQKEYVPSHEDIQTLDILLKNPNIGGLQSFKYLVGPLYSVSTLRFLFHLFGLPTIQMDIEHENISFSLKNKTRKVAQTLIKHRKTRRLIF